MEENVGASLSGGGYARAKFGFNFTTDIERMHLIRQLQSVYEGRPLVNAETMEPLNDFEIARTRNTISDQLNAILVENESANRLARSDVPGVLMRGRDMKYHKVGKALMRGSSWHGQKIFKPEEFAP